MSAPWSSLQNKAERALKAIVTDDILAADRGNATPYLGFSGDIEITLPAIICTFDESLEEEPADSGNFWLMGGVEIWSDADTDSTGEAHAAIVGAVYDQIWYDTLADRLSAKVSDFTCFGIRNRRVQAQVKEEKRLVTEIRFEALCAPQDF